MLNTKSEKEPFLIERGPGYFEYQLPISVKAVVSWSGKLPLLKNERDEWELPGGKLEVGELPQICLTREIEEELGWKVEVSEPFYAWVYAIMPHRHVFVLTFLATYLGEDAPVYSNEHKELVLVDPVQVPELNMPEPYKESIALAARRGHFGPVPS